MSLLNINLGILAYSDGPASTNPSIRLADLKWSMMGLPTENFRNIPVSLAPGESMTIASTARTLSYSTSTTLTLTKQGTDRMRIAAPLAQRTSRSFGDATTEWTIAVNGTVTRLQWTGNGTAPNFSTIQIGDTANLYGFTTFNNGQFLIMSTGSNYIDFINAYSQAQAATTGSILSIYSNGPVQVGDILDITSPQFSFPNQGAFPVVEVTDTYIDVVNPNMFPQVVTNVAAGSLSVYPYAYKWMMIAVDRKVRVGLNGQAPGAVEVEPAVEGDLNKQPGIFLKRGKVFEVQIMNSGLQQVSGFLVLAE